MLELLIIGEKISTLTMAKINFLLAAQVQCPSHGSRSNDLGPLSVTIWLSCSSLESYDRLHKGIHQKSNSTDQANR